MKRSPHNMIAKRILAVMLSITIVFGVIPTSTVTALAATASHPNYVTITVTDENGVAIEGATVNFTIDSVANGDGYKSDSKSTDSNGTVDILSSDDYVADDMKVSATVSKTGYATDTSISGASIDAEDKDFSVSLISTAITDVSVSATTVTYDGNSYPAAVVSGIKSDDTVLYKLGDADWTNTMPQISDAGLYSLTVKVERSGYDDYVNTVSPKVEKANLDISVTSLEKEYDGESSDAVSITAGIKEGDTVTYKLNDGAESDSIPQVKNAGNYTVKVKVHRDDNYNDFVKDYTVKIKAINIGNLSASLYSGTYDGAAHDAVTAINGTQSGDSIEYKLNNGDWTSSVPKVQDAGEYTISIKVTRENYNDTEINNLTPSAIVINKAEQNIQFVDSHTEKNVTVDALAANNIYDFAATGGSMADPVITYAVKNDSKNDSVDISQIAEIDTNGKLTVKKGGCNIKVIATVAGNSNYKEASVEYGFNILEETDLIAFSENNIDYEIGTSDVVAEQKITKTYSDDNGVVTYTANVVGIAGLTLDQAGLTMQADKLVVNSYAKLAEAVENNGSLNILVTANKRPGTKKAEYTGNDEKVYGEDSATYSVTIHYGTTPAETYQLQDPEGNVLSEANGTNGWFNTAVTVVPASDSYVIAKGTPEGFGSSVEFNDQGSAERKVYLRNTITGAISAPITVDIARIDSVKPDSNFITIEYSNSLFENFWFYNPDVTITITGYDVTSGIDHFNWKYTRSDDASETNMASDAGSVMAVQDSSDEGKYTATITLPKDEADQLRGYLSVNATDKAGLTSEDKTDDGRVIVVDTVNPECTVSYELKDIGGTQQTVGTDHFYSDDVKVTFGIEEANFFGEDVVIEVSKNGGARETKAVAWDSVVGSDHHQAELELTERGRYVVYMTYTDRSGNQMVPYESETIIIDKDAPVIEFKYSNDNNTSAEPDTEQYVEIKITDDNFRASDIQLQLTCVDITGNTVTTNDLAAFLHEDNNWINVGKEHKVIMDDELLDGIYSMTLDYKDLALNSAVTVTSGEFIVDRTAPAIADMTISYSDLLPQPIRDILSVITQRFYSSEVTVTFSAKDVTSGIDHFNWSYERSDGVSETNREKYEDTEPLPAIQDPSDKSKFTASVKLPLEVAEQLRGNFAFTATDKYSNKSERYTDSDNEIIVDTIEPGSTVTYDLATLNGTKQEVGGHKYFSNDVKCVFDIKEANFFGEDVSIKVSKDGAAEQKKTVSWVPTSVPDNYRAELILAEEGDYVVSMSYTDRSGNTMEAYKSNIITIDKTAPVIEFEYSNGNNKTAASGNEQTATITITEHNFRAKDVVLNMTAKDINENSVTTIDFVNYLKKEDSWVTTGDVHTVTISDDFADAIYSMTFNYKDMALNEAEKVISGEFIVDHTAPSDLEIAYSDPIPQPIRSILSAVTLGFYNPDVTVTFKAKDPISEVDKFTWSYVKEAGASNVNVSAYTDISLTAEQDDTDGSLYTATQKLPLEEAEQLRGNISFFATDNYSNQSDTLTDSGTVIVVDTINPELQVSHEKEEQEYNERFYYSSDVHFTFKLKEANFYPEDVHVTVAKDGKDAEEQEVAWELTTEEDTYETAITLSDEGDYVVFVTYTDRSNNEMTTYQSENITIDKTDPVIAFNYSNGNEKTAAAENEQKATITITEHNFRASDVVLDMTAEDINGTAVTTKDFVDYLKQEDSWVTTGDVHTVTISDDFADAIYSMTLNYTDLALRDAKEVTSGEFIVDHTAPDIADMQITYSTPLLQRIISVLSFGYYKPDVTVTFTGKDPVSGIRDFTWSYLKQEGASEVNVAAYEDETLTTVQSSSDKSEFTVSRTLPKETAEQLRGSITCYATDKYSNTSNSITDSGNVIIVDTIAPEIKATYEPSRTVAGKMYFNKDATVTFSVTEANFYSEDVTVEVSKNGGDFAKVNASWTDQSTDVHIGTYTITANSDHSNDADYVFRVTYTDRSSNQMNTYTSDIVVIDTINPVIDVTYANKDVKNTLQDAEKHSRKYFDATQTATITVTEHNFASDEVDFTIIAKDVGGTALNADSLSSKSEWISNGDMHTITITYPGNANYTFDVAYTDLATNKMADYAEDYFTVDKAAPTDMTVAYSASVLDTVLSGLTLGFYNAKMTVTITATDNISGVHSFDYSYLKAAGVSGVNAELAHQTIKEDAIEFSNNGKKATAKFQIPKAALGRDNQFNGTVKFTANDRAENTSAEFADKKRVVVDNIAPTANVEYNAPVQTVNGVSYYADAVTATVTVNEANFYSGDVHVAVTKDGTAYNVTPSWSDRGTDVHVGTFTLADDGDYFINITYADKSTNQMAAYTSEQLTVDTQIVDPVITVNGEEANGKAFKDNVIPAVSFEDENYESYEVTLTRTRYDAKDEDVAERFLAPGISVNDKGGSGTFDTFDKEADVDGIYTMTVSVTDKAKNTTEISSTFTVNRFGSVYEYDDYLISLIENGGAYVQEVKENLIITEYNADKLVADSLDVAISKDGKPLEDTVFTTTPEINDQVSVGSSGWYQYKYTIDKTNFQADGVYKIAISSKDKTGNAPETTNYEDKEILFRVDSTAPEISSISGLEQSIINAQSVTVKYNVYDTIGLASIAVYVDEEEVDHITDFSSDMSNYEGSFELSEEKTARKIQLVVTDLAGNVTDTSTEAFKSACAYTFNDSVTVSTNPFVRAIAWMGQNIPVVVGVVAVASGSVSGGVVLIRRRKRIKAGE